MELSAENIAWWTKLKETIGVKVLRTPFNYFMALFSPEGVLVLTAHLCKINEIVAKYYMLQAMHTGVYSLFKATLNVKY